MSLIVINTLNVHAFTSGDLTEIRELLHPQKGGPSLPYSLAYGTLKEGKSSAPHRLLRNKEVYYILSGTARLRADGTVHDLKMGDCFCIPENALQSIENAGKEELQFLCIVSPPWRAEDEDISGR
ncbi:MAG: cupin domain-containing protein [Saprospiraceae bacterium]|nr:MAG: cupin domain-containing protein [Saprospiraceae bacterium]